MQTVWGGFSCGSDNVVTTEALTAYKCQVRLTAMAPTEIALPPTVHGVRLYTADVALTYGIDQVPQAMPETGTLVLDFNAFVAGDILLPNQWQRCEIPDDTLSHTLYLVSQESNVLVTVILLKED